MKYTYAFSSSLIGLFLITVTAAHADTGPLISPLPSGMLNDVVNQYNAASATWMDTALEWANDIFVGLIFLDFVWSLIELILQQRQLEVYFASLIKRFFFIGTAFFIMSNTPAITRGAVGDFFNIGEDISGLYSPEQITPDSIFNEGIKVSNALYANLSNSISKQNWSMQTLEANPQQSAALLVQLAYGSVAAQLLITEIQIFLVIGCGAFLLGFMGTRWTLPYADSYPKMILASGMKLVSITVIVSLGDTLSIYWLRMAKPTHAHPHLLASEYSTIAASAIVYGTIALSLPSIMQSFAGASLETGGRSLLGGASGGAGGGGNTQGQPAGGGGYANQTTQAQAQDRLKALERAAGPF